MIQRGQVAIVTGARQGIGKAISLRFAKEGADIDIFDTNRETATKTSEEIRQQGRRSVVVEADVSDHNR